MWTMPELYSIDFEMIQRFSKGLRLEVESRAFSSKAALTFEEETLKEKDGNNFEILPKIHIFVGEIWNTSASYRPKCIQLQTC